MSTTLTVFLYILSLEYNNKDFHRFKMPTMMNCEETVQKMKIEIEKDSQMIIFCGHEDHDRFVHGDWEIKSKSKNENN